MGTHGEITAPAPSTISGIGSTIAELVTPGLLRSDDSGKLIPALAEVADFSPDGRKLTIRLRPDLKFSDGTPLTSREAVQSYLAVKQRDIAWGAAQLEAIRALDDRTIEVTPARPYLMPALLIFGVAKEDAAHAGSWIGAGPYAVATHDAQKLVLQRNMHYAGTPPGVERIEFQRYEQAAEEWARLLAHEVDLITFVPWTKEGWIRRIPSVRPVASLSKSLAEIQFVRPAAPFDNPRVRYALALAIDRAAIVQATFGGHASSAIGVVWPNDPGFEKDLPPYAYTPDEARRILVDAGATAASDGTLEWKGQPLAFHLDYLAGFSELEESALFLQKQLGDIGVVVELGARTIPEMEQQLVGGNAPATLLLFRHATSDLLSDREVRGLPPATPGSPVSDQRRLREQPPSIYLFWPERLDVIDKRFCGLPRLPDGPEPALDRVHLCARGEVE